MGNVESLDKIDYKKADPKGMISQIESFPALCGEALGIAENFVIPSYYIKAKKVILVGMGTSGQANDMAKDLLLSKTDLVIESLHGYTLPGFLDKDTIIIANSYSGNDEEVLSAFIEGYEKGAKLMAITKGGKLKILAQKYSAPVFCYDYDSLSRVAFPFQFILLLSIFSKLGYIESFENSVLDAVDLLDDLIAKYGSHTSVFSNPAKILAEKLNGKIPLIYTSGNLIGTGKRAKAQFNQNAKNLAFIEELPDLNHASIEGLFNPKNSNILVVMLESNWEVERIIKRQNITSEILNKNKIPVERIKFLQCSDLIGEILVFVMFFDFVSYYLSLLNRIHPTTNNLVEQFEERLG